MTKSLRSTKANAAKKHELIQLRKLNNVSYTIQLASKEIS